MAKELECVPEEDVCEEVDCSSHGDCVEIAGDPFCVCEDGYEPVGLECIEIVDVCEGVECSGHGFCVDTGEPVCVCDDGYEPAGLECIPEEDVCDGVDCSFHGNCVVLNGEPICVCDDGYEQVGLECIEIVDMCEGVDCSGHGFCIVKDESAYCVCDEGYVQQDLVECVEEPGLCDGVDCDGHGTCAEIEETAVCLCDEGYHNCGPLNCVKDRVSEGLLCSQDDWCWSMPQPQGNDLKAIWGTGENDLWIAGDVGTVIHWNGESWTRHDLGTKNNLEDIWGAGETIWVVGEDGEIYERTDGAWNKNETGNGELLRGVWGSSDEDVWVVGIDGTMLHKSDQTWQYWPIDTSRTLSAIHGSSENDIWAVGHYGTIFKWNGVEWQDFSVPTDEFLKDVWSVDENEAWAAYQTPDWNPGIWHWNGTNWNHIDTVEDKGGIYCVWGSEDDEAWVMGHSGTALYWDGLGWISRSIDTEYSISDIWGYDRQNAWAVGHNGVIMRWDGGTWSNVIEPHKTTTARKISGNSSCNIVVAGGTSVDTYEGYNAWTFNGNTWNDFYSGTTKPIQDMFFGPDGDLYTVGGHYWYPYEIDNAGGGFINHWDGESWEYQLTEDNDTLFGIWGDGYGNMVAVGTHGTAYQIQDGNWTAMDLQIDAYLYDVWGTEQGHLYIVGDYKFPEPYWGPGVVLYWDGSEWDELVSYSPYFGVWGSDVSHVWIVGDAIMFCDVQDCQFQNNISLQTLFGVCGTDENDVWAVGENGTVMHWDGTEWKQEDSGTDMTLFDVWIDDMNRVWVVGGDIYNGESQSTILVKEIL